MEQEIAENTLMLSSTNLVMGRDLAFQSDCLLSRPWHIVSPTYTLFVCTLVNVAIFIVGGSLIQDPSA